MKENFKPLARQEQLVVQNLDGEILIYDLRTNKALCLNPTSSLIWQFCDGTKEIPEIKEVLFKELKSPVNDDLIWLALEQLKSENLLENREEFVTGFAHLSRREVIKRVGFASMVALPVIASMVAPSTAYGAASSCVANDGVCSVSAQCCSNCCKNVGGGINNCKPGGGACLP